MNCNLESNISKKKQDEEKHIYSLHSIITKTINNKSQTRLKDGGYVAWPKDKLPPVQRNTGDLNISDCRLKDGGYVAYPYNVSDYEKFNHR